MLNQIDALPPELAQADPQDLAEILGGPTLLHLPGQKAPPLFLSVLLHGNESTGWLAARELLREFYLQPGRAPRALSLLIGNTAAASRGLRRLDEQPDYNRIWRPVAEPTAEHQMARTVLAEMERRGVYAAVDLHNNTGRNPHYGCVNKLDDDFLGLAQAFSDTIVFFRQPDTVISRAFSEFCPAITLECGQPGDPGGTEHARAYIRSLLTGDALPQYNPEHTSEVFHTTAIVRLAEGVHFGFAEDARADLRFVNDLDGLNFRPAPPGTLIAASNGKGAGAILVTDEQGRPATERYFLFSNGEWRTRVPVMLSMLTLDKEVIRQDCLCYLMERYPLERRATLQ